MGPAAHCVEVAVPPVAAEVVGAAMNMNIVTFTSAKMNSMATQDGWNTNANTDTNMNMFGVVGVHKPNSTSAFRLLLANDNA